MPLPPARSSKTFEQRAKLLLAALSTDEKLSLMDSRAAAVPR